MLGTFRFRAAAVVVTVLAALLATATPAYALAPTSTTPADGAVVQPPATVEVSYDMSIDQGASTLVLKNKLGNSVAGNVTFDDALFADTIIFTPAAPLTEAASPYTAVAHAEAQIGSETHDKQFSFTVDTTDPAAPTIADATDPVNAANDQAFVVSGGAEDGSTVEVTVTDSGSGEVSDTTDGGAWELTLDISSLADGPLSVVATATDDAGNVSPASEPTPVTKDTVAPAAPVFDFDNDPAPVDETNQGAVSISGTAERNADIRVSIDDDGHASTAPVVVSTTADDAGDWSIDSIDLSSLVEGEITAIATATDAAGNKSGNGSATTTKDLGPPGLVSTSPAGGATVQSPAEITATFSEPLDPGSTITVHDRTGTLLDGSTTFRDGDKMIVFTPASAPVEAGSPYDVTVHADDAQGNQTTLVEFSFSVDNTAPVAPTITDASDPVNAAGDEAFEVSGGGEEGATIDVTVTDASSQVVTDSTTVVSVWDVLLDVSDLDDGTLTVTATATDEAGNTSSPTEITVTKDTVAPAAPTIESATDPVTPADEGAVEISGDAESGSSVDVTVTDEDSATVSETTTAGDGWAVTVDVSSLADGTLTITATATDAAGNTSAPSAPAEVTKTGPTGVTFSSTAEQIHGTYTPVAGDFNGDGATDIIWYAPGTANDYLWMSDSNGDHTSSSMTINGDYVPIVGEFSGDTSADILWYAPGRAHDYLTTSNGDGTFTSTRTAVNGVYTPVAGDYNGDLLTDIIWYAPGTNPDYLWMSTSGGQFSSSALRIDGTYTPMVGEFTGDTYHDIIWYAPGTANDWLWTSDGDGFSSSRTTVNGTYEPIVTDFNGDGTSDILWYGPGTATDILWLSTPSGTYSASHVTINGTYIPVAGEFSGDDLFDILWYAPGRAGDYLWTTSLS